MTSDREMLKVKSTSRRNAGNGSTIMASTTMTSTGTPRPLRANSPKVAAEGAGVHTSAYSSPSLGSGRARRAASGRIQGADPEDVGEHLRHGEIQTRRNLLVESVDRYSARASFGDSNTGTRCSSAMRRMFCATRSAPFASTRGARMFFGSYFSATAKWVGLTITTSARRHLVHHAAPRHRLLHLADALLGLRPAVALLRLVAHFLARHAQRCA